MPLDEQAAGYLAALAGSAQVQGGVAYSDALRVSRLDYSTESLVRVDALIDHVREKFAPAPESLGHDQALGNFLLTLAFYVGEVVARSSRLSVTWRSLDEHVAADPRQADLYRSADPMITMAIAVYPRGVFLPLNAITTRLFEGPDEKSVAYSAKALFAEPAKAAAAPAGSAARTGSTSGAAARVRRQRLPPPPAGSAARDRAIGGICLVVAGVLGSTAYALNPSTLGILAGAAALIVTLEGLRRLINPRRR